MLVTHVVLTPDKCLSGIPSAWTQLAHLCGYSLSYLSLPVSLESLLRMKADTAEVDEFTFSQGTSDQESNGSGSYYIKQEPWGHGVRTEHDNTGQDTHLENPSKHLECGVRVPWNHTPMLQVSSGVSMRRMRKLEGFMLLKMKRPSELSVHLVAVCAHTRPLRARGQPELCLGHGYLGIHFCTTSRRCSVGFPLLSEQPDEWITKPTLFRQKWVVLQVDTSLSSLCQNLGHAQRPVETVTTIYWARS